MRGLGTCIAVNWGALLQPRGQGSSGSLAEVSRQRPICWNAMSAAGFLQAPFNVFVKNTGNQGLVGNSFHECPFLQTA